MTPDNPLLKALLTQPYDDTLRLAIADWLDEHDQPARAEFIRVQIELARGIADREQRNQLEVRQRDLLLANEYEWVRPLAEVLDSRTGQWGGWVFRRGFVEYFHLPASVVTRRGHKLARLTPVRELLLRPATPLQVINLIKRPWIASLTALYLPTTHLTEPALRALLECPHLNGLRVLHYNGSSGDAETLSAFQKRFHHTLPPVSS